MLFSYKTISQISMTRIKLLLDRWWRLPGTAALSMLMILLSLSVLWKWYVTKHLTFFKILFKGNNFAVGRVRERGKFDFYHYFAFLTNFLKRQNFLLGHICFGSSIGSFSKKMSQTDLPFKFCQKYLFLAEKWSFVVVVVCFVCCNFVRFWLTFFFN